MWRACCPAWEPSHVSHLSSSTNLKQEPSKWTHWRMKSSLACPTPFAREERDLSSILYRAFILILRSPLKAWPMPWLYWNILLCSRKFHFNSGTTSLGGLDVPLRKAVLGCIVISRKCVLLIGSVFKGCLPPLHVSSVCVFSSYLPLQLWFKISASWLSLLRKVQKENPVGHSDMAGAGLSITNHHQSHSGSHAHSAEAQPRTVWGWPLESAVFI